MGLLKELIEQHKANFESKESGRLLEMFELFELYHSSNKDRLIEIAKSYVNFSNLNVTGKKMIDWDLSEAIYFIHFQPDGELKKIIQNLIWYWDGRIDGRTLLTNQARLRRDVGEVCLATPTNGLGNQ